MDDKGGGVKGGVVPGMATGKTAGGGGGGGQEDRDRGWRMRTGREVGEV